MDKNATGQPSHTIKFKNEIVHNQHAKATKAQRKGHTNRTIAMQSFLYICFPNHKKQPKLSLDSSLLT